MQWNGTGSQQAACRGTRVKLGGSRIECPPFLFISLCFWCLVGLGREKTVNKRFPAAAEKVDDASSSKKFFLILSGCPRVLNALITTLTSKLK
jgi:hypothetical protein